MGDAFPKRPTLKDLAKAAKVSLASASYAVNGTGSLGEQTRNHILRVAGEIGYRQNLNARATRTGQTGAIGLVLPDLSNPFFPTLAQSVIQAARIRGYSVYVTDTEGSESLERETIKELVDRNVDGLVWFPIRDSNTASLIVDNVPTIVLDRSLPGFETIQADYAEGGRRAAEYLVSRGHRRIGIVSGPTDIASMRQRRDGAADYVSAHAELAFVVANAFSIDLEPAVVQLVESRTATAIFAGADMIAVGILRLADGLGIRVPDDLSLIGFDDIPWASLSKPALTTMEMPLEQMAVEAVDAAIRLIGTGKRSHRRVILDVPLVERDSVRDLRQDRR